MTPVLSLYLNFLRVSAAIVVMLNHYMPFLFGADESLFPGHDAVIMFFVMSGYVVSYIVYEIENTPRVYLISRLVRMWSVAIPALIVSSFAAMIIGKDTLIAPAPGVNSLREFLFNGVANIFFLGESWGGDIASPYNAPMWSLNYEAWYYFIFGVWFFVSGWRRYVAVLTLCIAGGPKVLTLMPCWLLGVWLYASRKKLLFSPTASHLLFLSSILLYYLIYHYDLTKMSRDWLSVATLGESYHLGPSTSMIGDFILAPVIALNLVAVRNMPSVERLLAPLRQPINYAASFTLSLYLYHMPLLAIFYGEFDLGPTRRFVSTIAMLGLITLILLLGKLTEHRRNFLRSMLLRRTAPVIEIAHIEDV